MNDSRVDDILREHEQLVQRRLTAESHWTECAERVLTRQDDFQRKRMEGEKREEKVFDSTAPMGLERFTAAVESMLVPRTQKWHGLKSTSEELNERPNVKRWFEQVRDLMFRVRYSPFANFPSQYNESTMSLGAFGTGILFVDEDRGRGIRYKSCHLGGMWFAENDQGRIDVAHRKFEFTARQLAQKYGEDALPASVQKCLKNEPHKAFDVLHCVKPNAERNPRKADHRGMEFASYNILLAEKHLIGIGGYYKFPYAISRYVTSPNEIYGRSPAMLALGAIKLANEMKKTHLRQGHRALDPPVLLHDDGIMGRMQLKPGALNYGAVDDQGRPRVLPFETGAKFDVSFEMLQQERHSINDAFLVTLFQILIEHPTMTATEVLERAKEKGALLAPTMGRQQSESLGPMIVRELDILNRAGQLPPMPEELIEADGEYEIVYDSPLNRAQRAEEGAAINRWLESIVPLSQVKPEALDVVNVPEAARLLGEAYGVPAKIINSPDEVAAMQEGRAQAEQASMLLQAAPVAAESAEKLARAQQLTAAARA